MHSDVPNPGSAPRKQPSQSRHEDTITRSSRQELPQATTAIVPGSPRHSVPQCSSRLPSELSDAASEDIDIRPLKLRTWILQSSQPRLTWTYCSNANLLDLDIRSLASHVKHHSGLTTLTALNCRLQIAQESWSIDMVINDGPQSKEVQQVIRETLQSAYFDARSSFPMVNMFLRPTEKLACV